MSTDVMTIPEGTVTLLSTDLVGSTLLNQALGDESSQTIEREIKTLALEQMGKHGSTVIKDTGDGLMVGFPYAQRTRFPETK
jgi:class 3 adenylate cyclase